MTKFKKPLWTLICLTMLAVWGGCNGAQHLKQESLEATSNRLLQQATANALKSLDRIAIACNEIGQKYNQPEIRQQVATIKKQIWSSKKIWIEFGSRFKVVSRLRDCIIPEDEVDKLEKQYKIVEECLESIKNFVEIFSKDKAAAIFSEGHCLFWHSLSLSVLMSEGYGMAAEILEALAAGAVQPSSSLVFGHLHPRN